MSNNYPCSHDKWAGGKGSKRRPEDNDKYRENYDRIFGNKKEEEKDDRGSTPASIH